MLYESGKDPEEPGYHGPAVIKVEEIEGLTQVCGKNKITPPQKEILWVRLMKQIFTSIFNVLLWGTVIVEVCLIYTGNSDDIGTLTMLAFVVVAAGVLQWWQSFKQRA